jgi:hypothetical protein
MQPYPYDIPVPLASLPRLAALAALVSLGLACRTDWSKTGVFLDVGAEPGTFGPPPEQLSITWLAEDHGLFRDRVVPVRSTGDLLATVYIDIPEPGPTLQRRVVIRALMGGEVVAAGTARLLVVPDEWKTYRVMLTNRFLPDMDGDGVPDEIDACPGEDDLGTCVTHAPWPDAARPAGAPDAAVDGAPDLAGADRPSDSARVEAGPVDGPASRDVRPDTIVAVPADPPAPPTELAARLTEAGEGSLSWRDNAGDEREFQIERSEMARPFSRVGMVAANVTAFLDKTLMRPATHFAFRVRAANAAGVSPPSNVAGVWSLVPAVETKIRGRVFGSPEREPRFGLDKAFEGDTNTHYEAKEASGCFIGMELSDRQVAVTKLRYAPRKDMGAKMVGGKFQATNFAEDMGYLDLATITTAPGNTPTDLQLPAATPFRWVRYVGPANSSCMVAEFEVYGRAP